MPRPPKTWKKAELAVARLLGGRRCHFEDSDVEAGGWTGLALKLEKRGLTISCLTTYGRRLAAMSPNLSTMSSNFAPSTSVRV